MECIRRAVGCNADDDSGSDIEHAYRQRPAGQRGEHNSVALAGVRLPASAGARRRPLPSARKLGESRDTVPVRGGDVTPTVVWAFDLPLNGDVILGREANPNDLVEASEWTVIATRATTITSP